MLLHVDRHQDFDSQVNSGAQIRERKFQLIRLTAYVALAIMGISAVRKIYNFYQLDQMTEIDCSVSKSRDFTSYKKLAEEGKTTAQHCLAEMFKNGIEVDKSPPEARHWYKKASDQGLYLSKIELCRPSLYRDWSSKEINDADLGDLAGLCCPGKSACPWWPVFANDPYDSSSAGRGRFFGKAPGDF